MTPEIEKVARAIYEAAIDNPTTDPWPEAIARGIRYGGAMPPMVRQAYASARAAIEAMREPTQRMRDAAARKGWNPEGGQDIEECWPAMIDAALAEPPK